MDRGKSQKEEIIDFLGELLNDTVAYKAALLKACKRWDRDDVSAVHFEDLGMPFGIRVLPAPPHEHEAESEPAHP